MKRIQRTLGLLALLAFLGACSDKDPVLATVNGKEVKQSEFDAYLTLKHIPKKDEKRREEALDEFLKRKSLATTIESEGKLDKALIDAEVEEFRKEMLISRHFEQLLDEGVSDEAVQAQYSAEAAKYEEKKVHVAHILVRTDRRMSEEQKKAKLTTAQEVHAKLGSGGKFEELAREFSEDKISGSRGGDLGWIKEGTIDARFSERAFATKAGTFTEPFETPFGFHVLKVIEEPKTMRRPLGAVAGDIRYRLRSEAKKKEMERLEGAAVITKKKPYVLQPGAEDEKPAPARSAPSNAASPSPSDAASVGAEPPSAPGPTPPPTFPDAQAPAAAPTAPAAPAATTAKPKPAPAPRAPAPAPVAPAPAPAPAAPAP